MAIISREKLMAKVAENKIKTIKVPEWGGELGIAVVKAKDFEDFRQTIKRMDEAGDGFNAYVDLLIKLCVDKDGKPIFIESDKEWLMEQPVRIISKIVGRVIKENSISDDEAEEAEKNSEKADSQRSPLALPVNCT